jgi:hypothetical protein
MIEMERELITRLDECLAAIEAGESLGSCLARYPDEAEQLAPLLRIALALEDLPQPGPSGVTTRTAKNRFLAEAGLRRTSMQKGRARTDASTRSPVQRRITHTWSRLLGRVSTVSWSAPVRALGTAALTLALVLLIGGGAIYAASGSLPGDPLYGFKLLGEDIQRGLTLSDAGRIRLEETFTERRLTEVGHLLTLGRQEEVIFGGLLRERTGDRWQVADFPVVVSAQTRLEADPEIGLYVEIHGITQADGTVLARRVEIKGAKLIGRVEVMGRDHWRVAGEQVQVDAKTHLQGQLQVGDCVEVRARRFADGRLLALEIERSATCSPEDQGREDDGATTPTPTPTTTLTATPSPTALPTATPTPSPTVTVTPSRTPTVEDTVAPSPTAEVDDDDEELTPTLQPLPTSTLPPPASSPEPTDDSGDDDDDNGNENDDNSNGNDNDENSNDDSSNDNDDDDSSNTNDNGNSNDDDDDGNANDDDNSNDDDGGGDSNTNDSSREDSSDDIGGADNSNSDNRDSGS